MSKRIGRFIDISLKHIHRERLLAIYSILAQKLYSAYMDTQEYGRVLLLGLRNYNLELKAVDKVFTELEIESIQFEHSDGCINIKVLLNINILTYKYEDYVNKAYYLLKEDNLIDSDNTVEFLVYLCEVDISNVMCNVNMDDKTIDNIDLYMWLGLYHTHSFQASMNAFSDTTNLNGIAEYNAILIDYIELLNYLHYSLKPFKKKLVLQVSSDTLFLHSFEDILKINDDIQFYKFEYAFFNDEDHIDFLKSVLDKLNGRSTHMLFYIHTRNTVIMPKDLVYKCKYFGIYVEYVDNYDNWNFGRPDEV